MQFMIDRISYFLNLMSEIGIGEAESSVLYPKITGLAVFSLYLAPACCYERCFVLVLDGPDGALGNFSTQIDSNSELNDIMRLVYFVSHDQYTRTCGVGADIAFGFLEATIN
jgi:hypothetical protein